MSRALLRVILARYLELPLDEIEIDRNCPDCGRSHGRPRLLRRPEGRQAIEFSVSHGGDVLVFAFADNGPIGVDVEPVGALEEVDAELLDFTLTDTERLRVANGPPAQRERIFLRHWTGKEAILKALGTGLDVAPQTVALPPWSVNGKVTVTLPGSPPVALWLRAVEVGPAHVCTLATGQEVRELRSTSLSPAFILGRSGG